MTIAVVRRWLVIAALALGAAAALVRTPEPPHGRAAKAPVYKPPSGC
jgi:hypothetical protein